MPAILTLMGVAALLVSLPGPFDDAASNATTQSDSERRLTFQPTPAIAALPSKAKRWALIIGIDRYRDGQISPLKGAANDAHALAGALVQYAGFPADQIILLASDQPEERQPTRVNILRRLSNLKSLVPRDGLLLVSFAGHGIEREGQAFLLPSDAQVSEDVTFLAGFGLRDAVKLSIRSAGKLDQAFTEREVGEAILVAIRDSCGIKTSTTPSSKGWAIKP